MILKNRTLFIPAIIFSLICNIYLLSIYIEQSNLLEKSYTRQISCNDKYDLLFNSVSRSLIEKYAIEGTFFENGIVIIPKSKLVYRLNNQNCNACIENVSDLLRNNSSYLRDNIIIIGDFFNNAEMQYYKKEYFPAIINLKTKNKLDKTDVSYFFTLDSENRIRNVFIPDKNFPALTDLYLKNVLKCQK